MPMKIVSFDARYGDSLMFGRRMGIFILPMGKSGLSDSGSRRWNLLLQAMSGPVIVCLFICTVDDRKKGIVIRTGRDGLEDGSTQRVG